MRASTFVLFYYDLRVAFTSIQLLPFAYSNEEFAFGQRFIAAFCKWQVKLIYGTYTTLWNISHYFNASNIIISAFLHQNKAYCIVLVNYRYSIPSFQKISINQLVKRRIYSLVYCNMKFCKRNYDEENQYTIP